MLTQIRCHKPQSLIRVYSVCHSSNTFNSRKLNGCLQIPGQVWYVDKMSHYLGYTRHTEYKSFTYFLINKFDYQVVSEFNYSDPSLQRYNDSICSQRCCQLKRICCCKESLMDKMTCKKDLVLFLFPHRTYVLDIC